MAVVSRKLILPLMMLLGGVTDALAEEGDDALPPPPEAEDGQASTPQLTSPRQ